MAISKNRQGWRGADAADLGQYLRLYSAGNAAVGSIVHAVCSVCEGGQFAVLLDDEEGFACRRCASCGDEFVMLDSEVLADDAQAGDAACPCGGEIFNLAVGFAVRDNGDVCWIYLALRCVADGTLGVYADWKVDYSPTADLPTRV